MGRLDEDAVEMIHSRALFKKNVFVINLYSESL